MQRPRDRGGGERQHIDREPERLEPLLVLHPEAVLLVHHQEPEILEDHVLGQQPVGADHDVDLSRRQAGEGCLLLFRRAEAGQHLDLHREVGQPLDEGAAMLLGQNGGRHQHGHLLAALHRLERRAHGDLGLAVADVADQQPVHRPGLLHVPLDLLRRLALVGRVLVEKAGLQLALPLGIRREGVARR